MSLLLATHGLLDIASQGQLIYFTDYTYYREITIDNTGNPDALTADQILISLTSSNFDFSKVEASGYDIIFADTAGNQYSFWRKSFDKTAETAEFYVKITDGAAAVNHTIRIYYGFASATNQSSFSDTMVRASIESEMSHLYPLDTDLNDDIGAVNFTGANTIISDSGCGNGVYFNGTSATCHADLFSTWGSRNGFKITFILSETHQNGDAAFRIFSKRNISNTDLMDAFLNTDGTLGIRCKSNNVSTTIASTKTTFYAGVPYTLIIKWTETFIMGILDETLVGTMKISAMPRDGTETDFYLGSTVGISNWMNGWIIDFTVFNQNVYWRKLRAWSRMTKYVNDDFISKMAYNSIIAPSGGKAAGEPAGILDPVTNKPVVFYQNRTDGVIARMDSPDNGDTWANETTVMGQGTGGESVEVGRTNIFILSGEWYLTYQRLGSAPGAYLRKAQSANGISFGSNADLIGNPSFVDDKAIQNSSLIDDGGTLKMLLDCRNSTNPVFQVGYASGADLASLAFGETNPQSSLRLDESSGIYGAAFLFKVGNVYYCIINATPDGFTVTPTYNYMFMTDDPSANTWVRKYPDNLFMFGDSLAVDQDGNFKLLDAGSYVLGLGSVNWNANRPWGHIIIYKFNGTMAQLVTDISISVGTETANA